MRTLGLAVALLGVVAATAPMAANVDDDDDGARRAVTVMALNVYHGVNAEIFAVPGAESVPDLLARVSAVYNGYLTRNFPSAQSR